MKRSQGQAVKRGTNETAIGQAVKRRTVKQHRLFITMKQAVIKRYHSGNGKKKPPAAVSLFTVAI
ncbi:hypothetical protein JZM24_02755 [Candidatus Sodalis endolongispinus]|uniref:Uncharacterized protein n=1 Tax=Candidatus Sodalis endolongispinus TaxID=2812662 RepID=A0ABS5Y8S1_9GAMM|nr:hypothetical protein [Candidatus Sodalis endolongispinus]MBT9431343.1 hypothetical protein [Candidatus Sodalis endolongispinus]